MITLNINSNKKVEMIDVTGIIKDKLREAKVENGLLLINVPHTTAAVTINESADPDVRRDMINKINELVPFNDAYKHIEGNSAAHIKSTLYGSSECLMIEKSDLKLGTWQAIYFCEFDGPRQRKMNLKIIENSS